MAASTTPQLKYALSAFVVIRLLHDVWVFFDAVLLGKDEEEKHLSPSEVNDLIFWTHMQSAVSLCDRAIVTCVMLVCDASWLRSGIQLIFVAIALFYDAVIGLAVWGLLCLN